MPFDLSAEAPSSLSLSLLVRRLRRLRLRFRRFLRRPSAASASSVFFDKDVMSTSISSWHMAISWSLLHHSLLLSSSGSSALKPARLGRAEQSDCGGARISRI